MHKYFEATLLKQVSLYSILIQLVTSPHQVKH